MEWEAFFFHIATYLWYFSTYKIIYINFGVCFDCFTYSDVCVDVFMCVSKTTILCKGFGPPLVSLYFSSNQKDL